MNNSLVLSSICYKSLFNNRSWDARSGVYPPVQRHDTLSSLHRKFSGGLSAVINIHE